MSLFDAAVCQVVKDVSDKTLVPVPNRSSADYCKILSLIERKIRSWHLPWKSAYKYIPTELTLNDILAETVDVKDLLSSSVLFENYSSTPSYHKAGKIGGKIAEEFGVDISLNETMQVLLKLGDVMKQEVIWQKLYDKINGKMLKITHPLLKVIKSNKKRSLFLIGMVVTSGLTETINKDMTVSGDIDCSPQVSLNLKSSGTSDSKQHRQYTIPLGTTLAYSCYKVKFENDGALNLQLGDDLTDAPFVDKGEMFEVESVQQALSGLLTNKVSNNLVNMLKNILKNTPTCAFKLNVVVENAIDIFQGDVTCKITPKHLEKIFSEECYTNCSKFLENAGFLIDKNKNILVYQDRLEILISLNIFLDCLSEMSNAQIQILTDCNISHRDDIIFPMLKVIQSEDQLTQSYIESSKIFMKDHPVSRFLNSVGLELVEHDHSLRVEYLPKCQSVRQLRSSLVAVYGMCSV